jgi:hypothetical protein
MNPPSGGPAKGPISAGTVRKAIAPKSSLFGTSRRMMMRPTGTISAPPSPCTALAATSSPSEFEKPQAIDAAVKMAIARRNTARAPQRSASQPLIGMKIARLSR